MSEIDPTETIAEVIGGIDYDYEQRDQAKRIVTAIRTGIELRRSLWLALTADNPLSRLSKAPSSPVETTAGSGQRPDHTGVIRPADEAERTNTYLNAITNLGYDHWVDFSTRRLIASACMALADAELTELEASPCAHTALSKIYMAERDEALTNLDDKDATIERLWAQLNEATNVPDERLQLPNCGDRP